MKEGDIVKIATNRSKHLRRGTPVRIIRILSPRNERPILVEPPDSIMGGWFEATELESVEV